MPFYLEEYEDTWYLFQTTLCNTAIDNPNNFTKYDIVKYIAEYMDTDTVLFQSQVTTFPTFLLHYK